MEMLKAIDLFGRHVDGAGNWPYTTDHEATAYPGSWCKLRGDHPCGPETELHTYQTHVDDTLDLCAWGKLILCFVVKRDGGYYHFPALTDEEKAAAEQWLHEELGRRWVQDTKDHCERG